MNNDTVIARTGELLIERYQLYVLLPREPRPKDKGGGEGVRGGGGGRHDSLMRIKNLNPPDMGARRAS